jgi:predicted GH43/DUF377 family glycosyl hydrolase
MHLRFLLIAVAALLALTTLSLPGTFAASTQWVKYSSNPVLSPTAGSWDADFVTTPRVIYNGNMYQMWYQGSASGISQIGYATSSNGINWVKHGVVLSPGSTGQWDNSTIGLGSVLWNGTTYMMWYTGTNGVTFPGGAIGLATSPDGLIWTKYSANPVIKPSLLGNDQKYIAAPYVVRLNLTYSMWYTAKSAATPNINKIIYATSFDGIQWSKWPSPVFAPATDPIAWDAKSVYSPSAIWSGQLFGIWYSGIDQTGLVPRIGYATSADGADWKRSPNNPILTPGPPGTWDSAGVEQPSVVQVGASFMLFYDGYSAQQGQRIGMAMSPQGFTIPEFPIPTIQLVLVMIASSTVYVTFRNRSRRRN